MYILKNALRCISRAKGRNFLIAIIVLILSVSSCVGLSIKESNKTLKKQYAESMQITATLNMADMRNREGIPLNTLKEFANNKEVKDFYYTTSVYFAAGDGIEPLDVSGSFKQNKDFRKEFGDVENGESSTTTSTGSTTEVTSDEMSNIDNNEMPVNMSGTYSGTLYLLNNDTSSDNVSSTTDSTSSGTSAPSSTPDDTEGEPEGITPSAPSESAPTSPTEDSGTENEKGGQKGENSMPTPPEFSGNEGTTSDGNSSQNKGGNTGTMPTPPSNKGENGGGNRYFRGGDTHITNQFFFNMASMNDFTVVGYTSENALPAYLKEDDVLDLESDDLSCIISKNLAEENEFKTGDTFTLLNPNNDEETYKFTIKGICDTSLSSDSTDTSSNASFEDNYIHVSSLAIDKILTTSKTTNKSDTDEDSNKLEGIYAGTYTFANLNDYTAFKNNLSEDYTLVSEDVNNYETSIEQLETLGKYATYFLIVIFIIGAFVLIIINLFSIRDRKYEIGVLTAIGMKKHKVATQFVIELFIITFAALIIGSGIGAATSVPITNTLLKSINGTSTVQEMPTQNNSDIEMTGGEMQTPPDMANDKGARNFGFRAQNYIASVTSATDVTVILQMMLVGMGLTLVSALSAVTFIMRYEPLKILSNRD